jgi:hypothetical protein
VTSSPDVRGELRLRPSRLTRADPADALRREADDYPQYPVQGGGSGVGAALKLPTMLGCIVQ